MNALDELVQVYKDGGSFIDLSDIVLYLETKDFNLSTINVSRFDTAARQRMADLGFSVEAPTAENNWRRGGQLLAQAEREASRWRRIRYAKTHTRNTAQILKVEAAQPDADDDIILAAHHLKEAHEALERITT